MTPTSVSQRGAKAELIISELIGPAFQGLFHTQDSTELVRNPNMVTMFL